MIDDFRTHYFIVVDIANGHMKSLYDKCKIAKKLARDNNYKLTIMTGNIAFLNGNGYLERVGSKKSGYWKVNDLS